MLVISLRSDDTVCSYDYKVIANNLHYATKQDNFTSPNNPYCTQNKSSVERLSNNF
jgi:hypothetical protein